MVVVHVMLHVPFFIFGGMGCMGRFYYKTRRKGGGMHSLTCGKTKYLHETVYKYKCSLEMINLNSTTDYIQMLNVEQC